MMSSFIINSGSIISLIHPCSTRTFLQKQVYTATSFSGFLSYQHHHIGKLTKTRGKLGTSFYSTFHSEKSKSQHERDMRRDVLIKDHASKLQILMRIITGPLMKHFFNIDIKSSQEMNQSIDLEHNLLKSDFSATVHYPEDTKVESNTRAIVDYQIFQSLDVPMHRNFEVEDCTIRVDRQIDGDKKPPKEYLGPSSVVINLNQSMIRENNRKFCPQCVFQIERTTLYGSDCGVEHATFHQHYGQRKLHVFLRALGLRAFFSYGPSMNSLPFWPDKSSASLDCLFFSPGEDEWTEKSSPKLILQTLLLIADSRKYIEHFPAEVRPFLLKRLTRHLNKFNVMSSQDDRLVDNIIGMERAAEEACRQIELTEKSGKDIKNILDRDEYSEALRYRYSLESEHRHLNVWWEKGFLSREEEESLQRKVDEVYGNEDE